MRHYGWRPFAVMFPQLLNAAKMVLTYEPVQQGRRNDLTPSQALVTIFFSAIKVAERGSSQHQTMIPLAPGPRVETKYRNLKDQLHRWLLLIRKPLLIPAPPAFVFKVRNRALILATVLSVKSDQAYS